MMDVVFGLSDGRKHKDAFVCGLRQQQQQQQSRLPSVVRKDRVSSVRACHAAGIQPYERTKTMRL
jgi:hypothetical protein